MNDGLRSFLEKLSGTCPVKEKENVEEVIRSIDRCPLQLNFDDAKDLIGVDPYIEKKLEDFFSSKPAYIPKEGSIPRKIMKALFDSNCTVQSNSGLTKSDLMRELGIKLPPFSALSKSKTPYNPLSSIKTLETHDLVKRIKTTGKHQFALTEEGCNLCLEIFSQKTEEDEERPSQVVPKSCKMLVKQTEIELRSTFDVIDSLKRSTRHYSEDKSLPVGSIWFMRGDDVYDTVVQFDQYRYLSNGKFIRKVCASPFRNKFIIVTSKENPNYAGTKLRAAADFDVKILFLDTPASVAQFLDSLCDILDRSGVTIGSKEEIISLCEKSQFSKKVGDVWQQVLPIFPYCGPQMAASICNAFRTPFQLYESISSEDNPIEAFQKAVAAKGQKPRIETAKEIVRIFGHQI